MQDEVKAIYRKAMSQFDDSTDTALEQIFPALVENAGEVKGKLPEEVFVNYFLPYFSAKPEVAEKRSQILADWISVAGSPLREVTVVSNVGEPLYDVPPVLDTAFIQVNSTNTRSITSIADEANLMSNNMPVLGERFLSNGLKAKLNELQVDGLASVNQQRWSQIFTRYNITQAQETSTKTIVDKAVVDDEVYD